MGRHFYILKDEETLKNDRATLNGRKEVLKGVEDAPDGDKKGLNSDGEELKGNVGIIVLLYQYVKVDIFLYILSRQ